MEFKRDGKSCRKLTLACQKRDFMVYEQILKEDTITRTNEWITKFLQNFPNREMARVFFMGRLTTIAHEEGNSEEINPAVLNYASSNSKL